ncbi:efflux RND transporter permease subunit [Sphingobacterium sp. lm-10]|uniref:efflux RND transporter permease subunit n=1 Tax=Sphingobacterium sp. lm-10 TaxID=2944904 RepID=UPI002020FB8B|nr:efflux RND transporter permease subunit [Sphingobacterium sp. lm-10]MCL7986865.1 efflux RND transporter permease subunit [Sphingobacterium sp. lm-10]
MFESFIKRPVLSLVISIFISLLGILSIFTIPITQFPDIVPPSVMVKADYIGANAEVSTNAVAIPLERAINGVAGMTYMSSVSTNNGTTLIQVFFKVGMDPDVAAVSVQNRVATVLDELPEEVIKAGVITEKEVNSMLMYLNIFTEDETADERFIYNFTDINILKELKRIEGVGFAEIMGMRDYAMRIWVDPARLAAYSISTEEVIESLRRQNIEAAPGQTGISSDKMINMQQYVLRYPGKFSEPYEYENIPIRANSDGTIIRIRDVAQVEFGSLDYEMVSKTDGRPSASIMMKQLPGSNAQDVIKRVKEKMAELKESQFPSGMTYTMGYDVSRFLDASISSVLKTLIEAFILVFLVIFIFLQNFRATIIPVFAVPVCLVGAIFFIHMMGFSINLLTLFALVLAIGIVVDDAIVVVEAVYAKMEEEHLPPMEATIAAMNDVGKAIIAITLVMSAVFVPVAFLEGPVGIFYRQFSLTLASAIVISGLNALTLTPALCAIILRSPHDEKERKGILAKFFKGFNTVYDRIAGRYKNVLWKISGRRIVTLSMLVVFFIAAYGAGSILPGGFIPTEDQGMIYVAVTTPPGATVDRTETVLNEIDEIARGMEEVETVSILAGYSILTEVSGSSYGMGMINLADWSDRSKTVEDVMKELYANTDHITDGLIEFFPPPTVPGFGNAAGFELRLLDRSGNDDLQETAEILEQFIEDMNKHPAIDAASSTYDVNFPQYLLEIDYDLAAKKGISVENSMNTLQTLMGSIYATNFIRYGQMYKVMVQADAFSRSRPEDVLRMHVKTNDGSMVPYSSFIRMKRVYGPEQITRYNMFNSALVTGQAAPGFSSGQAIEAVETLAAELPPGFTIEWSGMTREEKISGNQAAYVFVLCLVFVYLLLSAQYESFLLPLPVILCLPAGLFGAFLLLNLLGLENNIYAQVALVMLIGLLGKNAILIVEYAVLKRQSGASILEATIEGAVARLRPILMTSFAFVAGLIPLMLATGAGALGNRSIGTASVGGMVIGTLLGVIIIPGLIVLFSKTPKKVKTGGKGAKIVGILVFFGLFITSCTVPKKTAKPEEMATPTTFNDFSADSAENISRLPWRSVFKDEMLISLIDTALLQNRDLQQALRRIESAQAYFKQRKAALLPQLEAAAEAGLTKYGHYTEEGIGNYDSNFSENLTEKEKIPEPAIPDYFVGLRSSWELDLWGKLRNRREAAFQTILAENEARRLLETELVSSIAETYYELMALDRMVSVYDENIQLHEDVLELMQIQKEAGKATELGVQQFKALLSGTKASREMVKQEIVMYEHHINSLIGRFYQPITRAIQDKSTWPLFDTLQVGTPDQLVNNRPDIRSAYFSMLSSANEQEAARLNFLPSVAVSPYLGLQSFHLDQLLNVNRSLTYGILGSITMPILNQRNLQAQYAIIQANYGVAFLEYEKRVLNAFNEVSNIIQTQQAIENRAVHVNDNVDALDASIEAANELFFAGRVTYLDIFTAQKEAVDAQINAVNVMKERAINQILLYKALGGGWR